MTRGTPASIRFTPNEWGKIKNFIKANPIFDSFSTLGRVATLCFIGEDRQFRVQIVAHNNDLDIPYFLAHEGITETEVRRTLTTPGVSAEKNHLIEKILRKARFEDVFHYLSLHDIFEALPTLRLPAIARKKWQQALHQYALARYSGGFPPRLSRP